MEIGTDKPRAPCSSRIPSSCFSFYIFCGQAFLLGTRCGCFQLGLSGAVALAMAADIVLRVVRALFSRVPSLQARDKHRSCPPAPFPARAALKDLWLAALSPEAQALPSFTFPREGGKKKEAFLVSIAVVMGCVFTSNRQAGLSSSAHCTYRVCLSATHSSKSYSAWLPVFSSDSNRLLEAKNKKSV